MSEYADTRYWEILPANIYQQKAALKDGNYTVELSKDGKTLYSEQIKIQKGSPVLVDISLPNV